jgi:hypothetical protein
MSDGTKGSTVEPERRRGARGETARSPKAPGSFLARSCHRCGRFSLSRRNLRFRRSEDTLLRQSVPLACRALSALLCNTCRARRSRASPDTATVTQLTSSRLSINNTSRRSNRGAGKGNLGSCCRVASLRHSPGGATRRAAGSGGDRNRTDDPLLAKQVLSQLSYTPRRCAATPPRQAHR